MIKTSRPLVEKPKVLVVEEKDGPAYFHIPDDAALHKAALFLVTQRFQQGWYGEPSDSQDPGMTADQLAALPEGRIKEIATAELRRYQDSVADQEDEDAFYENVKRAIEIQDGMEAWCILQDRMDGEYELVHLQPYGKY